LEHHRQHEEQWQQDYFPDQFWPYKIKSL